MRLRTLDHCNAEIILNGNIRLKQEIVDVLQEFECRPDPGTTESSPPDSEVAEQPPHRAIQEAFRRRGWRAEVLVSGTTYRKHFFDLYKDRVAIEIELSNREVLYRDYFRFLLAELEGMIDVGVIVTWDPQFEAHVVGGMSASRADLQQVRDDLGAVRQLLRIPIWAIGVS